MLVTIFSRVLMEVHVPVTGINAERRHQDVPAVKQDILEQGRGYSVMSDFDIAE